MQRSLGASSIAIISIAVLPVLVPGTANAEPYPWNQPASASPDVSITPKAQVEYEERLAAQSDSGPSNRQVDLSTPQTEAGKPAFDLEDAPWLLLGFLGLGAAGVAAGLSAYRTSHVRGPRGATS